MTALSIREYILKQAKEYGRTILIATHNMAEVDAICNRVAIIDKGKILACDTPAALKRSLGAPRSEEHTSELQSLRHLVCRLLLEKKKKKKICLTQKKIKQRQQ